jgi:hypothetical protein
MQEYMFYKVSAYDITKQKRMTFNPLLYEATSKESALEFANRIKKEFVKYYSSIRLIEEKHIVVEVVNL